MEKNHHNHELLIILDFGGQYNQLIARRVREAHIYCEVLPFDTPLKTIQEKGPRGIILTGGPGMLGDTEEENSLLVDKELFDLGIPVLGICYGCQLMAHLLGGRVARAPQREYGKTELTILNESDSHPTCALWKGIEKQSQCWMSHTDYVAQTPDNFEVTAMTANCPVAAMMNPSKNLYGLQFHPETTHTEFGTKILQNFLFEICDFKGDWTMKQVAAETIEKLKKQIGDKKVLCALSGGVDSTVAAALVQKAVGEQLTCVFVDHGLMRKNEGDEVEDFFRDQFAMNLIRVNAGTQFLGKLKGITDPEAKRKIIGEEFIRVFENEAKKIGKVDYLVQGTIYPDVIESGTKNARVIKSHHNVGGLPDVIDFEDIIEPLRDLFKDEVRSLGLELGIPENLVWRQPFPGPGLGIRIIGEVTAEKIAILQEADLVFRDEIMKAGLHRDINQYFAVLTNMRSVGVMGDERTYDFTVALRGVTTTDFMTAEWAKIPYDILEKISQRIVNEVQQVNRIVYDITSKPPATIEWE